MPYIHLNIKGIQKKVIIPCFILKPVSISSYLACFVQSYLKQSDLTPGLDAFNKVKLGKTTVHPVLAVVDIPINSLPYKFRNFILTGFHKALHHSKVLYS